MAMMPARWPARTARWASPDVSALADSRGAGDADADRAAQAGDEAVADLGLEFRFVFDLGDQTRTGQPLAAEEALPKIRSDGKTRAFIGIHVLSL